MRRLTLWQAVALSTQFGFILAVSVAVGLFLGWLVDHWFAVGVLPYFIGAMLGLVSGIYSVARLAQTFLK